jgi:hypothetical protein
MEPAIGDVLCRSESFSIHAESVANMIRVKNGAKRRKIFPGYINAEHPERSGCFIFSILKVLPIQE